jgi:hypothetical protein
MKFQAHYFGVCCMSYHTLCEAPLDSITHHETNQIQGVQCQKFFPHPRPELGGVQGKKSSLSDTQAAVSKVTGM